MQRAAHVAPSTFRRSGRIARPEQTPGEVAYSYGIVTLQIKAVDKDFHRDSTVASGAWAMQPRLDAALSPQPGRRRYP